MDTDKTNKINQDNGGLRLDGGKAPIHLIPPEAILALASHYGKGADKYEPRNWERGMDWSRVYDSLQRHALAFQMGEDYDPETGTHHMVCAAWNALALYVYHFRGAGMDDRPAMGPLNKTMHDQMLAAQRVLYDRASNPDRTWNVMGGK